MLDFYVSYTMKHGSMNIKLSQVFWSFVILHNLSSLLQNCDIYLSKTGEKEVHIQLAGKSQGNVLT